MGDSVQFNNGSLNATHYSWDFGDGVGSSSLANPQYIYTQAGLYTVTLQASNPAAADSFSLQVQVIERPGGGHNLYLPSVMNE